MAKVETKRAFACLCLGFTAYINGTNGLDLCSPRGCQLRKLKNSSLEKERAYLQAISIDFQMPHNKAISLFIRLTANKYEAMIYAASFSDFQPDSVSSKVSFIPRSSMSNSFIRFISSSSFGCPFILSRKTLRKKIATIFGSFVFPFSQLATVC